MNRTIAAAMLAGAMASASAAMAEVTSESGALNGRQITLHLHDFLTEAERTTLRLVLTNEQALAVFIPTQPRTGGFAALALSPDEGFIRDGAPVGSAQALSGLADAAAARGAAESECNRRRAPTSAACVTVLEVGPAQ